MEHEIGVGLIIGLIIASSIYVWNSNEFNKTQRIILLLCVLFAPLQWIGIIVVLIYNSYQKNNSSEKIEERGIKQENIKLDSSIKNLKELREKGILTDLEFNEKVAKIKFEKSQQDLKNSIEYKQLKSLLDSGVLTKEEFENKSKKIKDVISRDTSTIIEITLKDGRILKGFNKKNENSYIGARVNFEIQKADLSGHYISHNSLYIIENNIIAEVYNAHLIILKNKKIVTVYNKNKYILDYNDIVYFNDTIIKDGKHEIGFMKNFTTSNGRIRDISFLINFFD